MTMASPCFKASEGGDYTIERLNKLRKLPLDMKVLYTLTKIQQFYIENDGKVYVSFSGGKDSTVLLHIVRSKFPDVPAVFCDTGLEYPEIREYVKTFENVTWLRPEKSFKKVILEDGYPIISKEIAYAVHSAQIGGKWGDVKLGRDGRYGGKKYAFLKDAPFPIHSKCCDI